MCLYCNRFERENDFKECLRDAYLIQKVEKPTRHRVNHTSNILYWILISKDNLISKIDHLDSDHDVPEFQLYVGKEKSVKRDTTSMIR